MPLLAGTRAGAAITVVGFGLGFGITSLATPALLSDRYGTTAYATIAGRPTAPVTIAKAAAPLLHTTTGWTPRLAALAACCALAATGMLTRATTPAPDIGSAADNRATPASPAGHHRLARRDSLTTTSTALTHHADEKPGGLSSAESRPTDATDSQSVDPPATQQRM
ncbi:hypothetical protein AB0B39_27700 [Micromonospora sp. NPDC049114]|uniref:hypothetical protein n=1 Tax=unclassified Micromonospora TaxID=2617518 RepID=UPI0033EE687C